MNYEDIKKLINDMGDSKIDSLDIEFPEGIKISMKKNETNNFVESNNLRSETNETLTTKIKEQTIIEEKSELVKEDNFKKITSPMVGTFYESSSPKEAAFVKVGDKVKKGDVLCVIEAMKLMNEIESEFDGEIVEICVKNEEMVEFGKPLFKIK